MARDRRLRWTRDAKLKRLAKVQLFSACTKSDLARIAKLADELEVPAGRVLMRQGELGHECFVVLSGKARVSFRGNAKDLVLGPGSCIGELALLQRNGRRSATVTAESDMDLLVLGSREFAGLVDQVPAVGKRMLAAVAERLRSAERGKAAH
jgi:CRP-like cAMP-binding protein